MLRTYHASTVMLNATWQPILKSALAKLRKFARSDDFDASLKQVFGVEIESTELKQAWLAGNFGTLPNLEIIAASQINNARGAFAAATNTIYLSDELIKGRNLNAITEVFLEEYGHYLDSILNQQDTAGDEGEYFAAVVTGKTLSLSDITRLQTENDKVVVTLAGQAVEIEQNLPVISVGTTPTNAIENSTPGVFTLTRTGDFSSSLTVAYYLGGTANSGTDYSNLSSGTVTFAAGSAIATVIVNPLDDNLYEFAESVDLYLQTGTIYTVGTNSTATLTIADNELVVNKLADINNYGGIDYAPQISGNNVVWRSYDGRDYEIYLYNGTSTIQLTNNSYTDGSPQISGNNVVWQSYYTNFNKEIFLYNGTSTIQLTNNNYDDDSPQISGSNVVWTGSDGTDNEIYFYNGISTIQLTNNSYSDYSPQISGNNVVWTGFDGTDSEIYFYNGISTIQLTNNSYNEENPQISGNNAVWTGFDGTDNEIYFYNGISNIQLTNNSYNEENPQISGSNVVWNGASYYNIGIYLYKNGTTSLLTTYDGYYYGWSQISGNNIVWTGRQNATYLSPGDREVFYYNGTDIFKLTDNDYEDNYPQISGDKIVWYTSAHNAVSDDPGLAIYQATLLPPKTLPTITVAATDANAGETLITGTPNPGVFTLTRTASDVNPTVNYTITGTAANDIDYLQLTGTATFAPGSTTTTITVTPTDDFIFEGDETVNLTLTYGNGYNVGTAKTATVTIADNDAIPQLSINDVTITEGNSGTKNANFILSLSNPSSQTISVNYQTVDDDATTANNDYVAKTGTITFTPGQTTQTLPITINGDTVGEINEAFTVLLTNAVNATLVKNEGIGIIRNDDLPSVTVIPIYTQASESGFPGIFQLNRTGSTTKSLNINYNLSGTATNATDYAFLNGIATFAAGNSTALIFVNPLEDVIFEGNETATLNLLTGTGYTVGTGNNSTITIADNDLQPRITINDVTLTEGNSGTTTANFAVALSNPSAQTITVAYQTSDISSTAGADYLAQTGTITFNPGETSKTASVVINGDTAFESDETFKVNLNTPVNATIVDGEGIGTIINDDTVVTVTATDATAGETLNTVTPNIGVFTLTRQGIINNSLDVNYSLTGTATNGLDYTSLTGIAKFAANNNTTTVTITPSDDLIFEDSESVILNINAGTGYNLGTAQTATVIIADNDPQPTITINDVSLIEGNSGTKTANFNVTLANLSAQTVTVGYQTVDVTATAGSDYVTQTGTLTFNPGETSKPVSIVINGDTAVEGNETFKVNLTTPVNATITDAEGLGTINNDDIPVLTVNNLTVVEGLTNAIIAFTLNGPVNQDVSLNYTTTAGTAKVNSDFTPVTGTLTIPANTTTATLTIPILNDNLNEANETFNLVLSNPVGAVLSNTNAIVTITDTIQSSTTFTLPAGVENLQLTGTTAINGTGNTDNNVLTGNSANNILAGSDGNDTYRFTATTILGSDTIQETTTGGVDTIDFSGTTAAATLNLGLITTQTVVPTNLSLTLAANNVIENIIGGNGADRLTGNILSNSLTGGLGDDNLRGGDGADSLTGSAGNDILTGDAGIDQFIYRSERAYRISDIGSDILFDFTTGADKVVLSKTTFNALKSRVGNGFSQSSDFAVVGDDSLVDTQAAFIVYSGGSGNLFYNQNGITAGLGTGAAFANLFTMPTTLTAADFTVVA